MAKFKEKEVVIIKDLKEGAIYPFNIDDTDGRLLDATKDMAKLSGRVTTIDCVLDDIEGEYKITDDKRWYWNDNMFYSPSEIIVPGTKLKIRDDLHRGMQNMTYSVNEVMERLAGSIVTVKEVEHDYFDRLRIKINEDDGEWVWSPQMFEKVIFNESEKGVNNMQTKEKKVILKPDQKETLVNEMCDLLEEYRYSYSRYQIEKIVDEWFKAKEPLIRILSKHPNWNPDKFQIQFTHNFSRAQDEKARRVFFTWLYDKDFAGKLLAPLKINGTTLDKVDDEIYALTGNRAVPTYKDGHAFNTEKYINSIKKEIELKAQRSLFKGQYHTRESVQKKDNALKIYDILSEECTEQYISQEIADKLNAIDSELRVHRGHKTTKVVGKFCRMYGADMLEEEVYDYPSGTYITKKTYGSQYAKYCDAMNPLEIKRHTVLSLNPIDYLTMSFGNSWASCHTIDKLNIRDRGKSYSGCYSSGTMSYMLDETSLVFYTVNADYDGEKFELEDKISRNMFHFAEGKLIQGRVYPFDQTDDGNSCGNEIYKPYREIVQKIFADCMEVPNLWYNKKGTSECEKVAFHRGTHYPDIVHYSNCNVSYLRKNPTDTDFNFNKVQIGQRPICIECGERHTYNECINHCVDPGGEVCACCGGPISADDIENGYYRLTQEGYCHDSDECAVYCEYHEDYEMENDHEYVRGIGYFCEGGIENDTRVARCVSCGEVCRTDYYEGVRDVHEDYYCESCASEELIYVESQEEYYPNDEVRVCENCGEYFVEDDMKVIDGEYYCEDCAEEIEEENEESEESIA